jgi:hypothetical protein
MGKPHGINIQLKTIVRNTSHILLRSEHYIFQIVPKRNIANMKLLLSLAILMASISTSSICSAQSLEEFNQARTKTDRTLMMTLGSWATANFIVSGVGWATAKVDEAKYFHEMNVMWNTINLAIAIPGIIKAKRAKTNLSLAETIKEQHRAEKIFLFNSGLDLGYIATGFIFRSEAKSSVERKSQLNGYGNSLLLQGGFLFLFDLSSYFIHNTQSNKKLHKFLEKVEPSSSGIGLQFNLN